MKKQKLHFISGLPRSGSTLLAALLRQNPRFHAGMTSPVGGLFNGLLAQVSAGNELSVTISTEQRSRLLRGLFESFYADQKEDVLFDTNRLWCSQMPAILDLFPDAKVIACVRNVAWIMDSIERLYRKNPYENTRLFDNEARTVYGRVNALAQANSLVGFPWSALKEAFYGEQSKSLLLVDYELLAKAPEKVIPLIYQFIGEKPFKHDFNNVEYDAPEFDLGLGIQGMHKVRQKVSFEPRRSILPTDLFEKFNDNMFWQESNNSSFANIIGMQTKDEKQ